MDGRARGEIIERHLFVFTGAFILAFRKGPFWILESIIPIPVFKHMCFQLSALSLYRGSLCFPLRKFFSLSHLLSSLEFSLMNFFLSLFLILAVLSVGKRIFFKKKLNSPCSLEAMAHCFFNFTIYLGDTNPHPT